jgi:hypothetical protein
MILLMHLLMILLMTLLNLERAAVVSRDQVRYNKLELRMGGLFRSKADELWLGVKDTDKKEILCRRL